MTSIDVMKFANAETRHPHREILKLLARHVEFDGDEPLQPTVPRALIVGGGGDVRCDELKNFSVARIERAIDSLVEAQVVEERTDFWSGRRTLGIRELLDAVDAPNENSQRGGLPKGEERRPVAEVPVERWLAARDRWRRYCLRGPDFGVE